MYNRRTVSVTGVPVISEIAEVTSEQEVLAKSPCAITNVLLLWSPAKNGIG